MVYLVMSSTHLDTVDPNDLVVGMVHLPPGKTAESLLSSSDELHDSLRKFFRKIIKEQLKGPVERSIPPTNSSEQVNLVYEAESGDSLVLPYIGTSSEGGHCLRQLPTLKMRITVANL